MAFPKIKNKHALQPMFSMGFLMRKVGPEVKLPKKAVLIYANSLEELFVTELGLERMAALEEAIVNYNTLSIYKSARYDLLVIRLAIGAPLTAMISEDIIRLGVEQILIIGEAGGIRQDLAPGNLVLCTKAIRDVGTSEHYIKGGMYVKADKELTKKMGRIMKKSGIAIITGPTWSIDAPYTETRNEVEKYSKMGIVTVEMESAGLFAVASRRGIKASAVFIVSDVLRLDSGWSGFDSGEAYSKGLSILPKIARLFASE
jgi:uridine phosphorylase